MEHSTAILEDAKATIEAAASTSLPPGTLDTKTEPTESPGSDRGQNNYGRRKPKSTYPVEKWNSQANYGGKPPRGSNYQKERYAPPSVSAKEEDAPLPTRLEDADDERKRRVEDPDSRSNETSGGKRQRGENGGRNNNKRHKKGDMGRAEYFRDSPDKRQKTNASREKRLEANGPTYGAQFSQAEIDAQERRPKRKVAVMIGYSGTGYKGMQISPSEKTIEGDLFNAFIAAGAISKANADDPKKASLVRCARTDKGVHAAGNMISLKLIVEEDDIVEKINQHLSPQIRVWGIERTIGSFSCYQQCDSRWYEYLIPSHAFLPPHPSSWLAKKLEDFADEADDRVNYERRQEEVHGFWEVIEKNYIDPVLQTIDEDIRPDVIKALRGEDEADAKTAEETAETEQVVKAGRSLSGVEEMEDLKNDAEDAAIILHEPGMMENIKHEKDTSGVSEMEDRSNEKTEEAAIIINDPSVTNTFKIENDASGQPDEIPRPAQVESEIQGTAADPSTTQLASEETDRQVRLRAATKQLRKAYTTAKRRYRIHKSRIDRIQAALSKFVGTENYHNYTVQKTFRDPSAKRHIKSFVVNPSPILIGEGPDDEKSEWLSLKVHGQSFMMHQIRKMIGMITLLVRCGSDLTTLENSLTEARYSIPKVPGLGLLLERPVFDSYNDVQAPKHGREKLDFQKYDQEMEEFKQREIYERIFREEEERNEFAKFFNHVDNFKEPHFLYVTSKGLEATKGAKRALAEDIRPGLGEHEADS